MGKSLIINGADFSSVSVDSLSTVQYIEATMSSETDLKYIDTGVVPTKNTKVVLKIAGVSASCAILGGWKEDYNSGVFCVHNDGRNMYAGFGNQFVGDANLITDTEHTITLDRTGISVDGVVQHSFTDEDLPSGMPSILLFATNQAGKIYCCSNSNSLYYQYHLRVCSCKIYESDTLIKNLIAYKKDGKFGLLDLLTGDFYTSPNGNLFSGYDTSKEE